MQRTDCLKAYVTVRLRPFLEQNASEIFKSS